jgi:hypothetical protein
MITFIDSLSALFKHFDYQLKFAFGNTKEGNRRYIYEGKKDVVKVKIQDKKTT